MKTISEDDVEEGIVYDKYGRMKVHPDFHPNQGKVFTQDELEYLCAFYEVDHTRTMSFALGKSEASIRNKYFELKRKGFINFYKISYFEKLF